MGYTGFKEAAGDALRTDTVVPSKHTHVFVDATQLIIQCMYGSCGGMEDLLKHVYALFSWTVGRARPATPFFDPDNALGHIVVTHDESKAATYAKWYERVQRDRDTSAAPTRVDGGDPAAPPLDLNAPLGRDVRFPVGWQATLRSRKGRKRVFEAVAEYLVEKVPPVPGTTFTVVGPGVGAPIAPGAHPSPVRHRAVVSVLDPTGVTVHQFQDMPLGGLAHLDAAPAEAEAPAEAPAGAGTSEKGSGVVSPPPPPRGLGEADHVGPAVLSALLAQYPRFEVDEPSVVFLGSTDTDAVAVWSMWLLARQEHGPCNFQVYLDTPKPRSKPVVATGEGAAEGDEDAAEPAPEAEAGAGAGAGSATASKVAHPYVHINRCAEWAATLFPTLDRPAALANLLGCLALTCGTDVSIKIPRTSAKSTLPVIVANVRSNPDRAPFCACVTKGPGAFPRLQVGINPKAWRDSWWPGLSHGAALPKALGRFNLLAAARQAAFYLLLGIDDQEANRQLHADAAAFGFEWVHVDGELVCVPLNANPDKFSRSKQSARPDASAPAPAPASVFTFSPVESEEAGRECEGSPSKRLRV